MTKRIERGAAAVETAIILALFLVPLLLGLADVARLLHARIALQEAAQEGVFYYAYTQTTNDALVRTRTIQSISAPVLVAADVSPTCANVTRGGANASEITVTVTKDIDLLFPLISGPVMVTRTASGERFFPCPL